MPLPPASFDRDVSVRSRARDGDERVLVEHLVEVAHAEEDDGVAVLTLGVEVLPHRRREVSVGSQDHCSMLNASVHIMPRSRARVD